MWPWDHLAIGYITYSLGRRAAGRSPPDQGAALAVIGGSQLPDLVDKPLGWIVGVLPSGVSLAHSLLWAVPVCLAVSAWRRRRGRPEQGVAFAVGYLLHLPADAVYPAVLGGQPKLWLFFWPLTPGSHATPASAIDHLLGLLAQFGGVLAGPRGIAVIAIEAALLGSALVLWTLDGRPGHRLVRARFRTIDT